METLDFKPAFVRHKKSGVVYEYCGLNKFRNTITGAEGIVEDDKAREIFVINVELTVLINEYPVLRELISRLKLKIDK